ncbi:MAG: methyltransferase domain-containing protein [bacterium]
MERHLRVLRKAEVDQLHTWFKPDMRVLEIGGGSGFQASMLSSYGCKIFSIDLPNRHVCDKSYFPVGEYDGKNIPFKKDSFDMVFSSNVLEHIRDLKPIFKELKRVLKSDGIAIHVLPSSTWRFWTTIAHYFYLPQYILGKRIKYSNSINRPVVDGLIKGYSFLYLIKRALLPGPHGEHPSAVSELYYFRKSRWQKLFNRNGFEVFNTQKNHLFYTGYGLLLKLSLSLRRKLSIILGSSCHIFIMRSIPIKKF